MEDEVEMSSVLLEYLKVNSVFALRCILSLPKSKRTFVQIELSPAIEVLVGTSNQAALVCGRRGLRDKESVQSVIHLLVRKPIIYSSDDVFHVHSHCCEIRLTHIARHQFMEENNFSTLFSIFRHLLDSRRIKIFPDDALLFTGSVHITIFF